MESPEIYYCTNCQNQTSLKYSVYGNGCGIRFHYATCTKCNHTLQTHTIYGIINKNFEETFIKIRN